MTNLPGSPTTSTKTLLIRQINALAIRKGARSDLLKKSAAPSVIQSHPPTNMGMIIQQVGIDTESRQKVIWTSVKKLKIMAKMKKSSVERALDETMWVRKARPTASSTAVAGKRQ